LILVLSVIAVMNLLAILKRCLNVGARVSGMSSCYCDVFFGSNGTHCRYLHLMEAGVDTGFEPRSVASASTAATTRPQARATVMFDFIFSWCGKLISVVHGIAVGQSLAGLP
jgi:hypothetical protein